MIGRLRCWRRGHHDWEHRIFFIIAHYWRCRTCGLERPIGAMPEGTQAILERERREWLEREEEYQRARAEEQRREIERYEAVKRRRREEIARIAARLRATTGREPGEPT